MNAKPYIIIDITTTETELKHLLSNFTIPCIRLITNNTDIEVNPKKIIKLLNICHEQRTPLLLEDHYEISRDLGFDGVHIKKSNNDFEIILKMATEDFMIGVDCGYSKHAGIISAELGASYISFKIPEDINPIDPDLLSWWHETIEVPLVVEGCKSLNQYKQVKRISDFVTISPTDWKSQDTFNKIIKTLQ